MAGILRIGGKLLRVGGKLLRVVPGSAQQPTPAPTQPPDPAPNGNGATLTIASFPKSRWVYQDTGSGKAVPVSGTVSKAATIEARAIDAETGVALTNWATVQTVGAAGAFAGTHQVPRTAKYKFYKLQVRDTADPGTYFATANTFCVGMIGVMFGQSNSVGVPNNSDKYPNGSKGSFEYLNGEIIRIGNIDDSVSPSRWFGVGGYTAGPTGETGRRTGDGFVYFANMLVEAFNCNVLIAHRAVNGVSINSFLEGQENWSGNTNGLNGAGQKAIAPSVAELGGDIAFAFLQQGENDAGDGMTYAVRKQKLGQVHGQFHTLTGRDSSNFTLFIASLGPVSNSSIYAGSSTSKFGAIRAADVDYANNTPGACFATSLVDAKTSDGVHILGEGLSRGYRRAAKTVAAKYGVGTSGAGPRAVSAARSGSDVTLTVQHTGGTTLKDGAGGTGTALKGFEFKDAGGNVLAYTASLITSATTVKFTVTGTPTTVSYGMSNAPHSPDPTSATADPVLASALYDDSTYIDGIAGTAQSGVGGILQPFAAITITGS